MRIPSGHWTARRTVATATVLLLAAVVPAGAAAAGSVHHASAGGTEAVTSGVWAATAAPASLTFTDDTPQTSMVTNTGTVSLTGIGYDVTVSNPASGTPSFDVYVCPVAWSGGTCSGGAGTPVGGTFVSGSSTSVSSGVVPALGGHVYLEAVPSSVTSSVTVTLGTSIDPATQLRAPQVTNQ